MSSESEAAFQMAIKAESSNAIGVAMLLLRLGNLQRDVSEGVPEVLDRAVESHRQSVKLFAEALSMHHHATLRARHALSVTLRAKGDIHAANAEVEAILRDFYVDGEQTALSNDGKERKINVHDGHPIDQNHAFSDASDEITISPSQGSAATAVCEMLAYSRRADIRERESRSQQRK